MKKNKMLRLASVLLILVMLTTSIVGGTFAKYTTTGSASDTARVAKWGVVINTSGSLFGKNYKTGAESVPTTETASELSVKSSGTSAGAEKLVAPGTKSDASLAFAINGTPEVRTNVDVTIKAQDIYLEQGTYAVMRETTVTAATFMQKVISGIYTKTDGSNGNPDTYTKAGVEPFDASTTYYERSDEAIVETSAYYPVTYTATTTDTTDTTFSGKTKVTEIAGIIAGKLAAANDGESNTAQAEYATTKTCDPNTNLADTLKLDGISISWKWDFHTDAETDKKDTILGDLMAGSTVVAVDTDNVTVLTVDDTTGIVSKSGTEVGSVVTSFDITITATQVD